MDDALAQRIRQRAYELWEQAGRPHVHSDEFWLQAEREAFRADPQNGPGSLDDELGSEAPGVKLGLDH